jgi:hypothetical protein
MAVSGVDQTVWLAGFLTEILLIVVLLVRGEYKRFPIFLSLVVISLIDDPLFIWLSHTVSIATYYRLRAMSTVLDSLLQIGVLTEIAYKVLKPARETMPRRLLLGLALLLLLGFVTTLIWTLDQNGQSKSFELVFLRLQQIDFSFAFLRLGLFAAITGFSQMLGITWRNHVIRLAAGLAFYSAVSVVVQLTVSHLPQSNHEIYDSDYSLLNRIQVIAYFGALVFWVWSFLQKDAPRREFTPQMERILVTISQTARRNRVSLTRGLGHK